MSWEKKSQAQTPGSAIENIVTLGALPPRYDYTMENTETGETKVVNASNDKELGAKIAAGQFKDKK